MTCSHNVVFLLDTAGSVEKSRLHLCTLKILNYLGCRFGLAKVRWDFKFFDSLGAQGRTSQVRSFRELGSRTWEDFEEELENRLGNRGGVAHLPGPAPRATLTQNILKETLLDYQWDRPEIASPTKPVLRSQKNKVTLTAEKPRENSLSGDFVNTVFLFSPCPHSQRELLQFVSGSQAHRSDALPPLHGMAEKFIPKGIQDMMARQKITLYWLDTSEWFKLLESPDHIGYWMLVELVRLLGGTILPLVALTQSLNHQRVDPDPASPVESGSSQPPFRPWSIMNLPFESTLGCLFSSPSGLQASFPSQKGSLFLKTDGGEESRSWAVTLEPLTLGQRCFKSPVNIFLKCTMTGWDAPHAGYFRTENWVVRGRQTGASGQEALLFQQFVKCILAQGLHMVAEVSASGIFSPCTGIFSPISDATAVLSLLRIEPDAEAERSLLQAAAGGSISKDCDSSLPEMVNRVLSHSSDCSEGGSPASPKVLFPEWAHQELSCTPHWSLAVLESWYSFSNLCGASSHLMETFGLLRAGSAKKEEEDPKCKMDLTHALSEFYQRKSSDLSARSHQREHRKRQGVPRTPIRQKMKTMPRSLQMLNAARLNVKAQKSQPEGEQPAGEKVLQRLFPRRPNDSVEERGKMAKSKLCFRTEEEMLSYVIAHYQSAVTGGENMFAFAQEMVTAVNTFQKSNQEAAVNAIRNSLLKTSQALRQQLGGHTDKEIKIKECQLQVYLRLEMCLQCPSLQTDPDGTEELVEEVTEMLRILCLTEDPGYLARFLEEVVDTYVESMPKLLGDLYYSLGTQIPPKLASVLPADLFSDDSISQEGQTPRLPASAASVPISKPASLTDDAHQLEELRSRSAKKRRSTLARHRSVTEAPQNLRQIEVPQGPKNRSRKDNSRSCVIAKTEPAPQKVAVQEVTKVRRNLFNEKMLSPGKRSLAKIPRSQSVSALEGLKRKRSQSSGGARGSHKLLTKSVAETPLHKQISRRLLYKQIKGRCSDPGPEVGIVEESPEKDIACGLRRSPRIKQMLRDRTRSGSFYNAESSQRSILQRYSVHREAAGDQENVLGLVSPPVKKAIRSPKSLLFGAVLDDFSPGGKDSSRTSRTLSSDQPTLYATPRKSPFRSSWRLTSPPSVTLRRSPRIQQKAEPVLWKTPARKSVAAKSLGDLFSPCRQKSKSLPEFVGSKEGDLAREGVSSPSSMSAHQQALGKPERREALDDVFASPAGGSDSAAAPSASPPPCLLNAEGKFLSGLQSPRHSLRVAQKSASPTSARKQILASERVMPPERPFLAGLDSGPSEVTPTVFRGAPSDLSSRPKSISPAGAFSRAGDALLLPESSLWDQPVKTAAACALSPTGAPRAPASVSREPPLRPEKGNSPLPAKAPQSPPCIAEGDLDLSKRHEECSGRDSPSFSAKDNPFGKPVDTESLPLVEKLGQTMEALTSSMRRDSGGGTSPDSSWKKYGLLRDTAVVCERLDASSLFRNGLASSPRASQGREASPGALPAEKVEDGEPLAFRSPPGCSRTSVLHTPKSSCRTYTLRCTADRRQREAAARLGNPEMTTTAASSTPLAARALRSLAASPTYEVELMMQASGLPRLRIKRIPSGSAPEPEKPKGEETSLTQGELSLSCCGRHVGRQADPPSVSPSCVHSAHSTPGKLGAAGQTYICQSYTPTRCSPCAASPSQGIAGIPWTPSLRQKGKVTPEAIKDWPRRKRAGGGCGRSERQAGATGETAAWEAAGARTAEPFGGGSKALLLGEFELEGVYRLPDQSPCSDTEPSGDEGGRGETSHLCSRKRALVESPSPPEGAAQEVKRSCLKAASPGAAAHPSEQLSLGKGPVSSDGTVREAEEVFSFSGLTSPSSSGKSSISASGLRALTDSPLLYQGHPASLKKHPAGEDSDVFGAAGEDWSPFRGAVTRRRSVIRTYSRKRLLT
uniref:Treslin n=1 Tax=Pogona vitticeps TaxID=103695 RepID=A0A6J0SR29_9SAUR